MSCNVSWIKKLGRRELAGLFQAGMVLPEVEEALAKAREGGLRNRRCLQRERGTGACRSGPPPPRMPPRGSRRERPSISVDCWRPMPIMAKFNLGTLSAAVATHSHPSGWPLSNGDIASAVAHNLAEIRAVGLTSFSMKRGTGQIWLGGQDDQVMKASNSRYNDSALLWAQRQPWCQNFSNVSATEIMEDLNLTQKPQAVVGTGFVSAKAKGIKIGWT